MDHSQLENKRGSIVELKRYEEMLVTSKLGTSRHNEPLQAVVENQLNESALTETNNSVLERNRALLQYTATIANSNSNTDAFNYEFVQSLINGGADVNNAADQYEQTIFHEVARSWHVDVARFLLDNGCDINKKDRFGRTPLHVAAAVDHVEMTKFLLQNNADMDARTLGEHQAPIHYAAKNGAVKSLRMLLGFHANIDSLDGNQRTPLQLAAEWTRVTTSKVLIDEGAASCTLDSSGNSALCLLIDRLPNLALDALNQLHKSDVIRTEDSYYLQYLEASRQKIETKATRTPLETAVTTSKYEVVTHPVMQRLIHNKWVQYGRRSTILDLIFHFIFAVVWTSICLGTPIKGKDLYNPLEKRMWRIVLGVIVLLLTAFDIGIHIYTTKKSHKSQKKWVNWRLSQLEEDMNYCHPRWPQEQKYVENEIKRVKSLPLFDAFDAWFYLEWIILVLIIATFATHFAFFAIDTSATRYTYTHTVSIVNLLVWLRLLKYVRPFPGIGTLVIILGETSGDFANWAFLFLLLCVPLTAAFWINFGAVSTHPVHGYDHPKELLYSVFQIVIGDDFDFESIAKADPTMSRILVVVSVIAMTIVTLNLLIALLSDTFARVYSNAVANTIMQRAIKVVEAERTLRKKDKLKYREHMKTNCSPEVIKMSVDGKYSATPSDKAEQDMFSRLQNMKGTLDDRFSIVYGRNKTCDFDAILSSVKNLKDDQDSFSNDLSKIKEMVKMLPKNGKKRSQSRPGKERPNSAGGSGTTFFGRFSLKSKNKTIEPSREGNKRSKNESNDRSKRSRSLKDQSKKRRRRSEQTHSDADSIVPYKNALDRATGDEFGHRNQAYVSEKGSALKEQDDISL